MKVLIIDDQPEAVTGILDHCTAKEWTAEIIGFENYTAALADMKPDIVVLDWKDDINEVDAGREVFERIWADGFKPIIIFSAVVNSIVLDERYKSSDLIIRQPKGDEEPVLNYLDSISPFIPVISGLKRDFNSALIQALNSITIMSKVNGLSPNIMRYVFAKRVSTYFDEECGDAKPPAWIQYTSPAITKTLCVCDVLLKLTEDKKVSQTNNPSDYLILLTPSCDMAQGKADKVLCAHCHSKDRFHGYGLNEKPTDKQIEKIISTLNNGYNSSLISLPSIPGVFPSLTVDLKDTEFISINKISLSDKTIVPENDFCRIISIDSPFREQIVWAHMINSCRPGMPPRDMDSWAKELMKP